MKENDPSHHIVCAAVVPHTGCKVAAFYKILTSVLHSVPSGQTAANSGWLGLPLSSCVTMAAFPSCCILWRLQANQP